MAIDSPRIDRKEQVFSHGEINITPFVDVVLVLLIVFMVATPLGVSGVDVRIPKAVDSKSSPNTPETISVTIDHQGLTYLGQNKKKMSQSDLRKALELSKQGNPQVHLQIYADERVPYRYVMETLLQAQKSGITSIGMMGKVETPTSL